MSLKIPEVCKKSGSKHCDNKQGRVSFSFRLIHLKKNIEVSSSGRRTVIQEANELSSGDVLISLLNRKKSEKQKQNSRLHIQRIISSEENAKIHSASNIFHIKHHSSLHESSSSKSQAHHRVQPEILKERFFTSKGAKLSMQGSSCSSTSAQLWMATLIKIQFFYLALLNNLPISISTLPLNSVIKICMSKLILFLKSNNCASSVVSSLQSRYAGYSKMEFISSVLEMGNDSLLRACPLTNEATIEILSILKNLASCSFEFFSALHFGIECIKPSYIKPCLIGNVRALSFTIISKTVDARVRKLNIATIPILDASSNIVDFQVIAKQCSAVPFNRQRSKMLARQKSSAVCSSKELQQCLNFKLNPVIFRCKKLQWKRKTLTNKKQRYLSEGSQTQNKNVSALPIELSKQNSTSTESSANSDTCQKQILNNDKCLMPVNNNMEFLKNSDSHSQQPELETLQIPDTFVRKTVTLAFHAKILNSSLFGANTSKISGDFGNSSPRLEIASPQNNTSDNELCPTFKIYQDVSIWSRNTEKVKNCPEFPDANSQNVASKRAGSNGNHFKTEIIRKSAIRTRTNKVVKFTVSPEKKFTHPKEASTISDKSTRHSLSNESVTEIGSKEQLEVVNLQIGSNKVSTGVKRKRSFLNCDDMKMKEKISCLHSESQEEKLSYAKANDNVASGAITVKPLSISENAINADFSTDLHNHNVESKNLDPESFESLENSKFDSGSKPKISDQLSDVESSFSEETDAVSVQNNLTETNEKFIDFETFAAKRIKVSKESLCTVKSKCANFVSEDVKEIQNRSSEIHDLGQQYSLSSKSDSKKNEEVNDQVFNLAKFGLLDRDNLDKIPFVGFHTAAGKGISVSESALKTAEHKFSNFVYDDVGESERSLKNHKSAQMDFLNSKPSLGDQSENQGKLLQESNTAPIEDNLKEIPFIDIQTASRKGINISEQTLTVVERIFSGSTCDVITGTQLSLSSNSKSLRKVAINSSSKDEPRGKSLFMKQTSEILVENDLDSLPVAGFPATTEKKNICTAALNIAKDKFSDLMANEIVTNKERLPESSASSPNSSVNLVSNFEDDVRLKIDPVPLKSNRNDLPFVGFQTASGKRINISDEALNAVKHKYFASDEMVNSELFSKNLESLQNAPIDSKFIDHIEDDNFQKKTTNEVSVITDLNKAPCVGLQAVAGEKTSSSEEALNVIREKISNFLPNDDMDVQALSPKNPDCSLECLLNSKEHVGNGKELPEKNGMFSVENIRNNAPFVGFQTAAGRSIKVSKEALNAVRNKFLNYMPEAPENEMSVISYGTAQRTMGMLSSGNITKEQLSTIPSISSTEDNLDINAFSGFQAASSKSVKTSEKSLNADKRKICSLFNSDPINSKNLDAMKPIYLNSSSKNTPHQNDLLLSRSRNDLRQKVVTGFQTAAGKNINIADKAFSAVKEKFADVFANKYSGANETESLVSLMSAYPEPEQKSADSNSESLLCSNQSSAEKNSWRFQTAAGKNIDISNDALTVSKTKFSDLLADETEDENKIVSPNIQCVQCESFVAVPSPVNMQNAGSKLQGSSSLSFDNNLNSGKFIGFQTAGRKSINISEKVLNAVKTKFSDIFSNENLDCEKSPINSESAETRLEKECRSKVSEETVPSHSKNAIGFQTAGGKSINISEKALNAVKTKFSDLFSNEDLDCEKSPINSESAETRLEKECRSKVSEETIPSHSKNAFGFRTAGGKSINISEKALNAVKTKFSDIFSNEDLDCEKSPIDSESAETRLEKECSSKVSEETIPSHPKHAFGFQTAGGKSINISEKALNAVKTKFSDIFSNEDLDCEKSPINSESAETRLEKECRSKVSEETVPSHSKNAIGFQTAGGKSINISEKALNAVKTKFSDIFSNEDLDCEKSPINSESAETRLEKECRSKVSEETIPSHSKNAFGFQTAGGKSINISEKALNAVKTKFSDIFSNEDLDCEKSPINSESAETRLEKECRSKVSEETVPSHSKNAFGFQTAGGKSINISEKALNAVKTKFSGIFSNENLDCEKSPINSESAETRLEKECRSKVSEETVPSHSKNAFGFQTAGGKSINISEKALNAVKTKFSGIFSNENLDCEKSPINSESAETRLEKECRSKVSEETIPSHSKNAFGFQTAGGKSINISEKALNAVKTKFSEIFSNEDLDCEKSPINSESAETRLEKECRSKVSEETVPSHSKNAIFFQTAGGKSLNISEKALNAVKTKFSGIFSNENLDCEKSPINSESAETRLEKECRSKVSIENDPSHSKNAIGFQTATGKSVSVSRSALNVMKRKFGDLLDDEAQPIALDSFKKPFLSSNVENDPKQKRFCTKSDPCVLEASSLGFQTAGGKGIKISEKALNTVKRKFSDTLYNEKFETEDSPIDSVFMEKFQNLSSNLKTMPNEKVYSKLTDLTTVNGNVDENIVHIEKNENISKAILNAAEEKLNCTLPNNSRGNQRSVTTDFERSATISRILNQIKIVDFDGCKCSDYKNTEESMKSCSSPSSIMNNSSTECSFICPRCLKPCEFAVMHTIQLPKFSDSHLTSGKINQKVFSFNVRKVPYQKSNYILNVKIKLSGHPLNNEASVAKSKVEFVNILDQVKELRRQQAQSVATKRQVKIRPGQLTVLKQSTDHHKRLKLRNLATASAPGYYSTNELLSYGVKQHILEVNSESAKNFVFEEKDFDGYPCINAYCFTIGDNAAIILNDSKCAGREEFFSAFSDSPGVDPSLISDIWFYNHYRWIVWKLASLEFSFPSVCSKNSLIPHNVMLQMKFRYDSEIDSSKRSALKKIIERDDTPTKTLVLIISSITKCESEELENKNIGGDIYKVKVSDGWYEISAKIDSAMGNLIKKNKINVGSKIITSGAELCGSDVACCPLEIPDCLQLKIHTNSTRVTQWDVKLGYYQNPRPFPVSLSSIIPDGGGCIGHISVVINRVYPILYMEKYENGHRITRNEKMELKIQAQHQKLQEHHLNRIRISIVKAFEERLEKKNSASRRKQSSHRSKLLDGEDLYNALNCAVDVQAFLGSLDVQQISLLEEFEKRQMERKRFQIEAEINNAVTEAKNAGEYPIDRNVTPVLKVLVKGSHKIDLRSDKGIILNIWRPNSDMLEFFTEGTAMGIYYLIPSRYQNNIIHLNSMKTTRYERISLEKTVIETVYEPRKVTQFSDISPQFSNSVVIDIIGFVYHVTESSGSVMKSIDMLYLADANYSSLVIKFPDGLASSECQDFLTVGNVIAVCNLKLDSNSNEFPLSGVATLVTTFSCNPKATYLNRAVESLKEQIMNPTQFIKQAKALLENKLEGRGRKSKYRPAPNEYHDANSAKRHKSDETYLNAMNGQAWNSIDKVPNPKTPLLSECQPKKLFASVEDRLLKLGSMPSPPPLRNLNFNASLSTRSHYRSPK